MIGHSNRTNPLTGHRVEHSENLTAIPECPLTGHRRKRLRRGDSENPLTGHRHRHPVIRQESCPSEMVSFRPSRDPIFSNNSVSDVVSIQQSVDMTGTLSRERLSGETISIFTEKNPRSRGATPVMISTTDNVSMVNGSDVNFPVAESQVSLFSHRRTPPRRSISMRSERSAFYAERNMVKSLHATSTSFDRSPIESADVPPRPNSVCTESSTFGLRSRWAFASSEKIPTVTLLGRHRRRFEADDEGINDRANNDRANNDRADNDRTHNDDANDDHMSVESLDLLPLESAQLEMDRKALEELRSNHKEKDADKKSKKTNVSLTQTKAMFESFRNKIRKSLRRTKSNIETKSKPEIRNRKLSANIVDELNSRPKSVPIDMSFSTGINSNIESEGRLSKSLENNRCFRDFEKSSIKSFDKNSNAGPDLPEKPIRHSFLRSSQKSLNASKEAIRNTYVNLMAPVKCLARDDSRLEDITRSKEYTRKSIRHANSNLESENMKEPTIIRSVNSIESRNRNSCTLENCPGIVETKPTKSNMDTSSFTIKRLEDKPSGRGAMVIESYVPENENLSTFNGLKQCIPDMSPRTPTLLPSYRPPPSEPLSVKSAHSSKSSSSSKKRNNSDLSNSSHEDNESQPRVAVPSNLKRKPRVAKRPPKKRANTENLSNGCLRNGNSSTTTTTTTTAEICPYPTKSPWVKGTNGEQGSNNTSDCSTPTASNTPIRKISRGNSSKFIKVTDKKGVPEVIPVPPPIAGTLKSDLQDSRNNSYSDQSMSNLNSSSTASSKVELRSKRKSSPPVLDRRPKSTSSEMDSTPTAVRQSNGPKKVWSRPVSNSSVISNSSNDMCINFEQLLKEIVDRRTSQMQNSKDISPTRIAMTS